MIRSTATESGSPPRESPPARPLRGLLIAQFFGAFNDNALKVFVAFLAMRSVVAAVGTSAYETASQIQTTLAFVALTLPHTLRRLPYGEDNPVDGIVLNDDVNIIAVDIEARNGVIHVIDAVLLP